MKYKIYKLRPYGKYSAQYWRNLSLDAAINLKLELENLNPDDVYEIEEQ